MKQSRRQELKTNDLSVYLQQTWESIQRNATYLIGGLVVVVLLVVVVMYNRRTSAQAGESAWVTLLSLQQRSAADPTRELVADIETALDAFGDRDDVGPRLRALHGQMSLRLAVSMGPTGDAKERLELLKAAQSELEGVIERNSSDAVLVSGARMGLAAVYESLALIGEDAKGVDKARELYQKVIDTRDQPYTEVATRLQGVLDEPLKPIGLVTTRPASATQPASMPASLVEAPPAPEVTVPVELPVAEPPAEETPAEPAPAEESPAEPEPAPETSAPPEPAPDEPPAADSASPADEPSAPITEPEG